MARILWADDEIDLLRSHHQFLDEKGYLVTPVNNGKDAIELVRNNSFDIVLLDEMMPGLDGLSTLEKIKELDANIPIIMITKNEEESLPSWWTNKLAVSSAYLNSLRDYIVYETNEGATVNAEDSSSSLLVFRDDDIDVVPVDNSEMLPPSVLQAREQNNAT